MSGQNVYVAFKIINDRDPCDQPEYWMSFSRTPFIIFSPTPFVRNNTSLSFEDVNLTFAKVPKELFKDYYDRCKNSIVEKLYVEDNDLVKVHYSTELCEYHFIEYK